MNSNLVYDNSEIINNPNIQNVKVKKGIKVVPESSFANLYNLTKVEMPNSIEEIGYGAFYNCGELREIVIPENCKLIDTACFSNCLKLRDVNFLGGVEEIGNNAFANCVELSNIELPEGLKTLGKNAFSGDNSLTKVVLPDSLKFMQYGTFYSCYNLTDVKLPKNLKNIPTNCFNECESLEKIDIPKTVEQIGDYAFRDCKCLREVETYDKLTTIYGSAFSRCNNLEKVKMADSVTSIGDFAFSDCVNLSEVKLSKNLTKLENATFNNCINLKNIIIPENVEVIGPRCFLNCSKLQSINIPKKCKEIENFAFCKCSELKEIDLTNVERIGTSAFKDCFNLNQIKLSSNLENVGSNAFIYCDFLYAYKLKNSNEIILSKTLPNNYEDNAVDKLISINEFKEIFNNYEIEQILNKDKFDLFYKLYLTAKSNKILIPGEFLNYLEDSNRLVDFINKSNFKFLKNEINSNIRFKIAVGLQEEKVDFYKFANCLGCFSNDKLLDGKGNVTNALWGQKASSFYAKMLSEEYLTLNQLHHILKNVPNNFKIDQQFLDFISHRGEKKEFDNLKTLIELDKSYENIFAKVMINFNDVKEMMIGLDETGEPFKRSWKETCISYYKRNKLKVVDPKDRYLADFYIAKGLNQYEFDSARKLYSYARGTNVKNHILDEPLKEESVFDMIEKIKSGTKEILKDSEEVLNNLYEKEFTYEMLDKSAPENSVIGMYCSCCATLTSSYYGKYIAKASIIENDVQNMVVRDRLGNIVAKGTMYVNEQLGYGVINDFELNRDYKVDEIINGKYKNDNPKLTKDRQKIFNAFLRGIDNFAKVYDRKHPDKPLKQVNVGMGFNRLSEICENFEKQKEILKVPEKYDFQDAYVEQRILYKKDEPIKTININDEMLK